MAWDQSLRFTVVRLTPKAWEWLGILTWKVYKGNRFPSAQVSNLFARVSGLKSGIIIVLLDFY